MSNTNGSTTLSKSMNGLIDINDGAGTDISNGNITCNSLTTKLSKLILLQLLL